MNLDLFELQQVKYILTQPQADHGQQGTQIVMDAQQLQGLLNSGAVKVRGFLNEWLHEDGEVTPPAHESGHSAVTASWSRN